MATKRQPAHSGEMMGKIDSIINSMAKQDTKLAVIEIKSTNTEEHLRTLNGKVQAHESRLQAQEGSIAVNSAVIAGMAEKDRNSTTFWERNWEKFFWSLFASTLAYILATFK